MKIGGRPDRLELKPETDEEKATAQRILDGDVFVYWGDSEFKGGALILNSCPASEHTGSEITSESA